MRKLLYIITLALVPMVSIGQITVNNAEDFSIGTVLKFQKCDSKEVSEGNSGVNQTWDFTTLKTIADTTIEWMVLPNETENSSSFPNANLVEKYSDGRFVYANKTQNENYLVGFIDAASKMTMNYTKPMLFAKRPMTFGTVVTDSFATKYTMNAMDFEGKGVVTIEADGYGKLILPNGTYNNVLRIKISQTQNDVLKQYSTKTKTTTISYVWFDGVHTSCLLKINMTKSGYYNKKSVEYLLSEKKE